MADEATLRAWWHHRQGLDGHLTGLAAADVLARTGWARSVGGSAPYLTLFARAGIGRDEVDEAVAAQEICELPSARGCTYVLPASDFPIGLTCGAGTAEAELAAAVKHLGVTRPEVGELCDAVLRMLEGAGRPLEPSALRRELGPAVRNLGEAGRKRGTTSTLPLALGLLQARGRIRRIPVNGRLDEQRFGYVPWVPSPLVDAPSGEAARTVLAARYFHWAGPASLKHFRWFSGFGAAAAAAAVAPLGLVPVGDLLALPETARELAAFEPPDEPSYALVSWIDGIHLLHRDLGRLLDPVDAARPEPASTRGRTLGELTDPPCQLIVDRGRVVGLWEYDPEAREVVRQLFVPEDDALRAAVERTEEFAREQLGDVRGGSLDSPASRVPRLDALR
ncbi:winged helix DNA-binding protein [Pseudonocardia hierapolitana]|uniref:Winged helix DNA-binding protein n=1 Tax=Pseudonocardia hierapolitana TaxID=1128676 RepID=A0A561SW05_9PSEU|nr:crosslink repair DNA glycosylase YcaQ family protein [Pseudonocardia hierapolitana]TWF79048.1 winged helix DNA-binding protein [Pseudonocardia hierapolitana]